MSEEEDAEVKAETSDTHRIGNEKSKAVNRVA
jgi:hypothetical protein